jgi:hypothetical protein
VLSVAASAAVAALRLNVFLTHHANLPPIVETLCSMENGRVFMRDYSLNESHSPLQLQSKTLISMAFPPAVSAFAQAKVQLSRHAGSDGSHNPSRIEECRFVPNGGKRAERWILAMRNRAPAQRAR